MQEITRILSDLIRFDTSSRNSNLELIAYIQEMLIACGVKSELTYDCGKGKANLLATLGVSKQPGIVLSGHTDVVPVNGQDWRYDPFEATITDDRVFGRGSCDMKGFIAVCLANIHNILDAELSVPFHFAFSYDEEVGCIGARGLIESLQKNVVMPAACIVGEPTNMHVVRAHKGMFHQKCSVYGKSAHSSLVHKGVNAVNIAARLITQINQIAKRIQQQGPYDEGFDPPYTSLHVGVIEGGTVNNIIPDKCCFEYEIRNIPTHSALSVAQEIVAYAEKKLLPEMKRVFDGATIKWQQLAEFPSLSTDENDEINQQAKNWLEQVGESQKVSYGTEGGLFHEAGIATIICGPGSINQAHKTDEFVLLEQLERCNYFIQQIIHHYTI